MVIRLSIAFILMVFGFQIQAQYKIRFIVTEASEIKRDNIFLTGSFNNWDSLADMKYILSDYGTNQRSIELILPKGIYHYKYTGGNWSTVEKAQSSNERLDREINLTKDTVVRDTVIQWRDLFLKNMEWSIAHAADDTIRLGLLANLANSYSFNSDFFNTDSTLYYIQQTLHQLQIIKSSSSLKDWKGYTNWLIYIQEMNASKLHALGNYPKSLELRLENLKMAEQKKSPYEIFVVTASMIDDYISMKDFSTALSYCKKLQTNFKQWKESDRDYDQAMGQLFYLTAICYYNLGLLDSALHYADSLHKLAIVMMKNILFGKALSSNLLGDIYSKKSNPDTAIFYYRAAAAEALKNTQVPIYFRALEGMAKLFKQSGQIDSALHYARSALGIIQNNIIELQVWGEDTNTYLADITPLVAELYKSNHQLDSAYKYLHLSVIVKDSLYNVTKERQFQNLSFNESLRQQQLEQQNREAKQQYETKLKMVSLGIFMAALLVFAIVLFKNNKQKQKANILLASQKKDIEKTLGELMITQKQLIQSEKMASLGELTAGIAHEIQNPLNFVNNFSEVNKEMISEMKDEIDKGNYDDVRIIANDIQANEEKINHHGKRADAIVKGMLQHSRSSSGQKERTDINALCDEYLRLSYHGLRAKDKSFNATLKTDFDESLSDDEAGIGKINIIPQDIGRVILNLITNAFYATNEKKKLVLKNYDPTVTIKTLKIPPSGGRGAEVLISVRDNGPGIPPKVLDKIFQPFFTTKPTGQGTGLGLSLSYDIVKAHGGELKVETNVGEGSTFIIELPIS